MTDLSPKVNNTEANDVAEHDTPAEELANQDTLIEDVSIDGMCGVY